MKKATPVHDYINPESTLRYLASHSQKVEQLQKLVREYLEPQLYEHCRVANFRRGCMVIEVNNAAWATKLRLVQMDLCTKIRVEGKFYQLSSIKISVQPTMQNTNLRKKKRKRHFQPSAKVTAAIKEQAADCTHPSLSNALEKLAKQLES